MMDFWAEMMQSGPESAVVDGVEIRRGSRVRLKPRAGGDVLDGALAGQLASVEAIDEDDEGKLHFSVTLDADPGRDLGERRFLGHRFFFSAEEIEPLHPDSPGVPTLKRVLVAGIGNVFLGDDGFGVAVAQCLAEQPVLPGVDVVDFGIRGMDLVYALQKDYAAVILVDATPRGGEPGTLYVIEPDVSGPGEIVLETHGMDPVKVLRTARAMGTIPPRALVVGCEPEAVISGDDFDAMRMELSDPVRAAVEKAAELVESLLAELTDPDEPVIVP